MTSAAARPFSLRTLGTERLLLFPMTPALVARRLRESRFTISLLDGAKPVVVHVEPDWPGDLLPVLPSLLESHNQEAWVEGSFVAVERSTGRAVAALGTKGYPDADGVVEIGYGVTPADRGRGLATEAVGALTAYLLGEPAVRMVTAETEVGNLASQRVLEANGFVRDGAFGSLLLWRRS